ncbi:ferredoxin [Nonomuraea sp. NPDC002799]
MSERMRITVDRERCVGAGMCALTAPALFDQSDEDGRVLLLGSAADAQDESARRAAVLCPSQAIHVTGQARAEPR